MKLYLKTKDFSISQETFELYHDEVLDMLVTKPTPENLQKYYESEDYISHTDSKKSFIDKVYNVVKHYSLKKKLSLINSFKTEQKRLLDIGAGTGDFLVITKKDGWEVLGVEPNLAAQEKAKKKGIHLINNLSHLEHQKFDVITLWHVLEHLPELDKQIAQISTLLDENGTLIVAVPNFKSYDAIHYGKFWAAFDVPRHLWHFSKDAIKQIFKKHSIRLITTKPMRFDSFYVSLLSEKYKSGSQRVISAFFIGLRSNLKAIRTKEYSSRIYILKKHLD